MHCKDIENAVPSYVCKATEQLASIMLCYHAACSGQSPEEFMMHFTR